MGLEKKIVVILSCFLSSFLSMIFDMFLKYAYYISVGVIVYIIHKSINLPMLGVDACVSRDSAVAPGCALRSSPACITMCPGPKSPGERVCCGTCLIGCGEELMS